jgi:methylmalonyl-CoA/ethylmalonyl-CoA epimerase
MITGLHHVGYVVPDLDRAIAFYEQTLGMKPVMRGPGWPGTGFDVAAFRLGDGSTAVELITPTSDTGPFADFLRANPNGGLHHVAYRTAGPLADAVPEIERCGLKMLPTTPGPTDAATGWRIINIDPSNTQGLLTQLGER